MAASNLNSNQNLYVHTASVAGGCGIKSVTTTSDLIVRIEELANSYGRLFASNLVTRSDEVASARRRCQFLTGPSGIAELKRTLKEGSVNCWRCISSERQQAVLSIRNLEYGLQKLRKEGWNKRKVLRSRVGDSKYWRIVTVHYQ